MAQPAEPMLDTLGGTQPAQVARRYLLATRPPFLAASVMPILVGTAWGRAQSGTLDVTVALIALLATAAVQAGTNVINDVGDEIGGTDRANVDRIFPYSGGSRFIQNGVMSLTEMKRWGVALVAGAMLLGALLAWMKGPVVVGIGLAGIALGVAYSLPPLHLAARGVGEIAVGLGLGFMPVMGSAWLQSGRLDGAAALVAVPTAMWVSAILLINEVPDIAADAGAGKRTLPVRIGVTGTRIVYAGMHLIALAGVAALVVLGHLHWGALLLPVALAGLGIATTAGISNDPARRAAQRASMERTLMMHTVGSVWIAAWAWFAH